MGDENIKIDFDGLYNMILEEKAEEREENLAVLHTTETSETKSSGDLSKTEEEERLEKLLFGGKEQLIKGLAAAVGEVRAEDSDCDSKSSKKRKPAWHDSDDEEYRVADVIKENKKNKFTTETVGHKPYKEYLRNKYNHLVAQPKWADLDREDDKDSDDEVLRTVGHLSASSSKALPPNNIFAKRLKDLNRETYAEGAITSIQFHPTSTAALVAGLSGIASIYSIDGKRNEKLHNIKFQNFPIRCARIAPSGTEAVVGGSKNYYYSYDLIKGEETRVFLPAAITKMRLFEVSPCGKYFAVAGRFGDVHLMDLRSKELLHSFKQEYPCSALYFSNDSRKLFTHSNGPEVNILDIRKEKIEHTFLDDGCINGTALAISPNGKMLATGSKEGVVNIYNYDEVFCSQTPRPQKIVYNLTTAISTVKFNHSSEILGITSEAIPAATKLIHFPSGTVFSNFPGFKPNLGQVGSLEFSPNSGFMALGNKTGAVPLFRLKHFSNY